MAIKTNETTLSDAIQAYLNRGFGSMTKNDFEVWIFDRLLRSKLNGMSNFDISAELRIPESKVKRLRYESSLKYGNPTDATLYNAKFHDLLNKVNLKKGSKDIIQFAVEDVQLRKYLESILKKKGRFADTLLNTEVVSIKIDDLALLLDETCSPEEKKDFMLKTNKPFKEIITDALKKVADTACNASLDTFVSMGLTTLMSVL